MTLPSYMRWHLLMTSLLGPSKWGGLYPLRAAQAEQAL